jgi:hypothetical protein
MHVQEHMHVTCACAVPFAHVVRTSMPGGRSPLVSEGSPARPQELSSTGHACFNTWQLKQTVRHLLLKTMSAEQQYVGPSSHGALWEQH